MAAAVGGVLTATAVFSQQAGTTTHPELLVFPPSVMLVPVFSPAVSASLYCPGALVASTSAGALEGVDSVPSATRRIVRLPASPVFHTPFVTSQTPNVTVRA